MSKTLTFHPMAEPGPIGMRLRRLEDGRLLRGTAQFADDLEPKGCLHVGLLRSPVASGELRGLDISPAQAAPGVRAVFAAADLDGTCLPLAVHLTMVGSSVILNQDAWVEWTNDEITGETQLGI